MKTLAILAHCVLLAACGSAPVAPTPELLFRDGLFGAPSQRIRSEDVFALSDSMKTYVRAEVLRENRDRRWALFNALYRKGDLRLEYDSAMTRNAAEAFAARSGNCLSLVIMTAAFAKEMGLPVRYQSAYTEDVWSRSAGVQVFVGHVNLSLGKTLADRSVVRGAPDELTIDFLAPLEIRGLRTREIAERTIVAMYMNNKAVEALAARRIDEAYAWARAAIEQDPGFASGYNTLGVIYHRHGNETEAERTLAYVLDRYPSNAHAMSNLVAVLNAQGRTAEAGALALRLEQIEPSPPFAYFYQGVQAMMVRDYPTAMDLFAKEVDRAPSYHEFRYWLGAAYLGLGQIEKAREQFKLAIEYSTSSGERDLYAAKLDRIASHSRQ